VAAGLSGTTIDGYTVTGQVQDIFQWVPGGPQKHVHITYDLDGQTNTITRYPDQNASALATSTYGYDGMGRLTTLNHIQGSAGSVIDDYTFQYDAASNMTQTGSTYNGTTTYTNCTGYDGTNQLTQVKDGSNNVEEGYVYDQNGNRTSATLATTTTWVTGADNRLLSDGIFNYAYDNNGNLLAQTRISNAPANDWETDYSWDHDSRLIGVTIKNNSGTVTKTLSYTYDAYGQQICRGLDDDGAGPGAITYTYNVYDGSDLYLQVTDTNSLSDDGAAAYVSQRYLEGQAVAQVFASEAFAANGNGMGALWGLGNNVGTVGDVVNSSGVVQDHRTYNSFGLVTSETNAAVDYIFGFQGEPTDKVTHLVTMGLRLDSPQMARFINQDPIDAGTNFYEFAGNNPRVNTDPTGLCDNLITLDNYWPTSGMAKYTGVDYTGTGVVNYSPSAPPTFTPYTTLTAPQAPVAAPSVNAAQEIPSMQAAPPQTLLGGLGSWWHDVWSRDYVSADGRAGTNILDSQFTNTVRVAVHDDIQPVLAAGAGLSQGLYNNTVGLFTNGPAYTWQQDCQGFCNVGNLLSNWGNVPDIQKRRIVLQTASAAAMSFGVGAAVGSATAGFSLTWGSSGSGVSFALAGGGDLMVPSIAISSPSVFPGLVATGAGGFTMFSTGQPGESDFPERVTNPKHHPNSASPEPTNAQELFDNSIVDNNGVRWAKDTDGTIHRFSKPSNGQSHWNGSTGGTDPIRLEDIPIAIRRAL
jgi:RHS repeat-associated protein